MEAERKTNNRYRISWVVTLGIPLLLLCIPDNDTYTLQIKLFLAVTVFAILTFAFENANQTVIALIFPIAYIALKLAPASVVMSPWTTNTPWMVLGGLILADVLADIGLLKRIAYKCIVLTGGTYQGILWGILAAGIVLGLLIPGKVAIPLAALSYGICKALNLGRSRESAGIMLVAAFSAIVPCSLMSFGPMYFIMVNAGLDATGPIPLSWLAYLQNNIVTIFLLITVVFIASKMFQPKEKIDGKEYFTAENQKLGPITSAEKKSLLVIALLFFSLITTNLHGLDAGWCFALIPPMLFLPGINVGRPEVLRSMNFGFIIFTGSCITIGSVAGALGLGKIVAGLIMPLIAGKSVTFVLFFVWMLCFVLNFLMTPVAVMSAFSLPLAEIALAMGINPHALYFTMWHGLDQILLPYEHSLYLVYFAFGFIRMKDFVQFFSMKLVVDAIFVVLILIPFWRWIGFLTIT